MKTSSPPQKLAWILLLILTSCSEPSDGDEAAAGKPLSEPGATAKPGEWSGFRGPGGLGTSQTKGLPLTWNLEENLAWKTALPGGGSSSPIVFGDHIYLTCYTGYLEPGQSGGSLNELKQHLLCLRKDTGEIRWNQSIKAKLPEEESIRDHGYAANTPAADADRVYAFFGKSGVYAFDHQGNQLWQADVGSKTSGWGTSASPVLFEDKVYINASVESESLVALDGKTGREKWRARGIKEAWSTPILVKTESGETELVISAKGKVLGFNPDSGEQLWSCDTDITWWVAPSPVAAEGIVYVLGGRSGVAALAVRAGGRGDVTATHRLWTSLKGSNVTSPVYHDGHLYWMNEKMGIAYCANGKTGELIYEERLNRVGQVYASSLLADGRVYHLSRSGRMFVVSAEPKFDLLATNELRDGSLFNASPAVMDNHLLLRSETFLYCVGR